MAPDPRPDDQASGERGHAPYRHDFQGEDHAAPRAKLSRSTTGAAMIEIEKQVADLTEAFAAQDLILREMLTMLIQLGRFSKAWDGDESGAALTVFISRLRVLAETKAPVRSAVLLEFAEHAERSLPDNQKPYRPPPSSGGSLQ